MVVSSVTDLALFQIAAAVIPCDLASEQASAIVPGLNILTGICNSSANPERKKLNPWSSWIPAFE